MRFDINIDSSVDEELYTDYCRYVYSRVKRTLSRLVSLNKEKYKVREKLILECPLIKWSGDTPSKINLSKYVLNCLEMVNINGTFIVRVNNSDVVKGSSTEVSTLIRILEYGTETVPELPLVRRVINYYRDYYDDLYYDFMEERLFTG